ncbi:MAG TPA: hypothetical protein VF612_08725 [Jatrophihabitans sp.]|jgi:hypothetical protein|uniref:hypothetical protein n=1 Tax=Jatrophihabitans sp. TaxID=1932789 RepID=UPI002EE81164
MSIATDVRAYADLALEQGKNVLSQAGTAVSTANQRLAADGPKTVFAALGVADLVAATVTKQAELLGKQAEMLGKRVETLPADAAENVARMQGTGRSLISKTQDDALTRITELRDRLDTGVDSVKALPMLSVTAASITTVYLSNAKQAFGKLATRGEARLAELRNDPRVTRVLGDLDEASSTLQARLAPVLGSVRSEVVPYLDSAVDTIKAADLEPATQPSRTSTARRRAAGTRAASASRNGTARSAATTRSTGRAAKATADDAGKAAAKATSSPRKAADKATSSPRKAADKVTSSPRKTAAKATSSPRKAAAKATSSSRKAAAAKTTAQARKAPATKA